MALAALAAVAAGAQKVPGADARLPAQLPRLLGQPLLASVPALVDALQRSTAPRAPVSASAEARGRARHVHTGTRTHRQCRWAEADISCMHGSVQRTDTGTRTASTGGPAAPSRRRCSLWPAALGVQRE
jgi:hypothetical protein